VINKGKLEYDGGVSDLSDDLLSNVYGIKFKKYKLTVKHSLVLRDIKRLKGGRVICVCS